MNLLFSRYLTSNLAFLEEFERSKELQLQRGFEVGYSSTLNEAIQRGKELGKLSMTAAMEKVPRKIKYIFMILINSRYYLHVL